LPITFAGFPATIEYGSIGFVTTDPAPIIAPFPICVVLCKIIEFKPIHTFSSMVSAEDQT